MKGGGEGRCGGSEGSRYRSYIRGAFLYLSAVSKRCPALPAFRSGSCKEVRAESYLTWHADRGGWASFWLPPQRIIHNAGQISGASAFNIARVPAELREDVSLMLEEREFPLSRSISRFQNRPVKDARFVQMAICKRLEPQLSVLFGGKKIRKE